MRTSEETGPATRARVCRDMKVRGERMSIFGDEGDLESVRGGGVASFSERCWSWNGRQNVWTIGRVV